MNACMRVTSKDKTNTCSTELFSHFPVDGKGICEGIKELFTFHSVFVGGLVTAEHLFLHANLSRWFAASLYGRGKVSQGKGEGLSLSFFRVGEGWEGHVSV